MITLREFINLNTGYNSVYRISFDFGATIGRITFYDVAEPLDFREYWERRIYNFQVYLTSEKESPKELFDIVLIPTTQDVQELLNAHPEFKRLNI